MNSQPTNPSRTIDSTLLIFGMLLFAAALTWVVPPGSFEKTEIEVEGAGTREVVIPGSFQFLEERSPQGIGEILMAPYEGFLAAADIIAFVLIVGGAFGVFLRTGAVAAGIQRIVSSASKNRSIEIAIIPILMTLFSLGGATYGMAEETVPMILIFVPLARALGYDTVVGVAIPFVGSAVGFAGAPLNPFTVGIAQGIAEVPIFSGQALRWGVWFAVTLVGIIFVMRYALMVKANPEKSAVYGIDVPNLKGSEISAQENDVLSTKHKLVLTSFMFGMGALIYGVLVYSWYIAEISALFLLIGIVVGVLGRLKASDISRAFMEGAGSLLTTALIIGLARAILVVLENGQIIDTILNFLASAIEGLGPILTAQLMFLTQTVINFIVPSGSGQAALTMPLMAPLADLVGVTRQTAVLAYQMGDGFTNMFVPTNPVLMGALAIGGIPWQKWAKWIIGLQLMLMLVGFVALAIAVSIGWA